MEVCSRRVWFKAPVELAGGCEDMRAFANRRSNTVDRPTAGKLAVPRYRQLLRTETRSPAGANRYQDSSSPRYGPWGASACPSLLSPQQVMVPSALIAHE